MYEHIIIIAKRDGIERLNVAIALYSEDKKVLICQRSSDKKFLPNIWHLPGGKVEEKETILEALKREVSEELGLKISDIEYTKITHNYVGHGNISARTEFFIGKSQGEIVLNEENQDYKWISSKEVKNFFDDHVIDINEKIISLIENKLN